MTFLKLDNICKSYGVGEAKVEALKSINLEIEKGEFIAIVGASGSGKSTLLNIIGALDTATEGEYIINGMNISSFNGRKLAKIRNKTFGFIVQYFALLNEYSIFDNIKVPLEYGGVKRKEIKGIIEKLLNRLNIQDKKNKRPSELSGGQCQRVAIARALANNPEIILADEPTGALDKKTGQEVINIFKELNNDGKTIIIVTHDMEIAKECHRNILVEDGRIIKDTKVVI